MFYFNLVDEPKTYFQLDSYSGEIRVDSSVESDVKYVLYCFARDQTNPEYRVSTSAIVRIDSFSDWKFLIDIHLSLTEEEYVAQSAQFLTALSDVLHPWVVKVYKVRSPGEKLKLARRRLLHAFNEAHDGE